jgi:GNAT superfamily N-acetyltransferase
MAACHANFIEAFRLVARARPQGRLEEERGVVRIASGMDSPSMNPVFVTETPQDPVEVITQSKRFMQSAGVSRWSMVAHEKIAGAFSFHPEAAELTVKKKLPGMLVVPIPSQAPPPPPGLRIRRATTPALWEHMVRTGTEGLSGTAAEDAATWPFELTRVIRGYLGDVGGVPVATSWGISYQGVCGIFFVATLPPFRGRGIGAAMTWRAVVDGRREGCRASFLQSTDMGLPVYSGMGFRQVTEYVSWRTA